MCPTHNDIDHMSKSKAPGRGFFLEVLPTNRLPPTPRAHQSRGPQLLRSPPDGIAARPVVHPLIVKSNNQVSQTRRRTQRRIFFQRSLTPRTFPRRRRAFPLFLVRIPHSYSLRTLHAARPVVHPLIVKSNNYKSHKPAGVPNDTPFFYEVSRCALFRGDNEHSHYSLFLILILVGPYR